MSYVKTYPMQFAGQRWWLTKPEIKHVQQLKEKFPNNWEAKVIEQTERRTLGLSFKKDEPEESISLEELLGDDYENRPGYVYANYRMHFAGRGWWFMKEEKEHIELLQKYFPQTWEKAALERIDNRTIGHLEQDYALQKKMSQGAIAEVKPIIPLTSEQ
ncbi:hypothetical protein [Kamptonema sp. UHCC 0994]|uniref:hypothetical protein n=1 Tax=Kamptonema sp. UHCC 0994 TaxID=3031329 RepID=UPI0023BA89E9|nr:hypothetical protein [Kamptonema sp. UHCC 0994]MDF0556399.1 hypothetical protein [Kamptonema sp. UHCC 0994]